MPACSFKPKELRILAVLPADLQSITFADLVRLKDNGVSESRHLEYKLTLPGPQLREISFLETIASFANDGPGDLILGVKAKDGVPADIPGCVLDFSTDATVLRLDQLIRDRLDPSYRQHRIQPIDLGNGRSVFVIRIPVSYARPHRVDNKGAIMGRGAAGKYPMDMSQVREMILETYALGDRVRGFRAKRLEELTDGRAPVRLSKGVIFTAHLVPISGIVGSNIRATPDIELGSQYFRPLLQGSGLSQLFNLEGTVFFERIPEGADCYTHVHRTGIIESTVVCSYRPGDSDDSPYLIDLREIGSRLLRHIPQWLTGLIRLEIGPPYYLLLSMSGLQNALVPCESSWRIDAGRPDRPTILVPEIEVPWPTDDVASAMRPAFEILWQAFGFDRCDLYRPDGRWAG